jgi:hypothetical protein
VVNAPASLSGGPGFKSGPVTGYHDWGFSWFSSVPPEEWREITPKLGDDRFLSNLQKRW